MPAPISTRIQLSYRDDLRLLVGRWLTDEVTLEDYQAEYDAVLAAAQAHGAWRWLLDIRRRPMPPAGAAPWLNEVFIPQASAAAPQHLCIAYLASPQRIRDIATDAQLQATTARLASGLPRAEAHLFNDEGEAMRWLTGKQAY